MTFAGERRALLIVPASDLVAAAVDGHAAVTVDTLLGRLADAFTPETAVADRTTTRVALSAVAARAAAGDRELHAIRERGGRSWLKVLDACEATLEDEAVTHDALEAIARRHDASGERCRFLLGVRSGVDALLAPAGLIAPTSQIARLTDRVAHAEPDAVVRALGATDLRARGLVDARASFLVLFRVLDAALSRAGGRATFEVPMVERPLDAERSRDPLEALSDAVARALDDAPAGVAIHSPALDGAPGEAVEVRPCTSREAQGRAVAHAVRAAMVGGEAPGDVVVALVSDDTASARAIVQTLGEAGIDCDDAVTSPGASNLVAFADGVLEAAERGVGRHDLARILRSPYTDLGPLLGQPDAVARKTVNQLARAFEETPTAAKKGTASRLEATILASRAAKGRSGPLLVRAALKIGQSFERVTEATTRGELVRAVRALWRDLGVGHRPTGAFARSGSHLDGLERSARRRDEVAWAHLEGLLRECDEGAARLGLADAPLTLEELRHDLAGLLASVRPPAPARSSAVSLVRLADLPSRAGALVVVAEADGASWPGESPRRDLVPSPLARELVLAADPALSALAELGGARTLARLALATDGARRVVFTYRVRDDDGEARAPASVVLRVAPVGELTTWSASPITALALSDHDALLARLAADPEAAKLTHPEASRRAVMERRREETFGAELEADHPLFRGLPRGEHFAALLTEETGGGGRPMSTTAIDVLASCGFRGYVHEVLRPRRGHDVSDVADPREAGRVAHAALEEAFRATAALWTARPRDEATILALAMEAADRVLGREHVSTELARVATRQLRAGVRAVIEWSIADTEWDFAVAEQPFGDEPSWPAVVLDDGHRRVAFRGRIDRVDVAREGSRVRVVDYKSRERTAEAHTNDFGASRFQLALYARAAEAGQGRARGEGLYLPLQRLRKGAPRTMRADRWDAAHELVDGVPRFALRVLDLVDDVRRGSVSVRPAGASSCAQCDYDGVCRKPRFAPAAPPDDADGR